MRPILRPLLLILALAALAACAPSGGMQRLSAGETVDIAFAGTQLSVQRATNGIVRPLLHSPQLQAAAAAQAEYMLRIGNFGHTGPAGSTPRQRAERAGYRACLTAENVARGQPDVSSVIAAWMNSSGHRANILNPQVTQFGFAHAGEYWVLVLARPC